MDEYTGQISRPERVCVRFPTVAAASSLSSVAIVRSAICDGGWPRPAQVDKTHISGDFALLHGGISVKLVAFAFWNMTKLRI